MQITELRIHKVENDEKLRAYVTVTLDECLVIHGVKIIEGQNGLFIAMPSKKSSNGSFKDIVHPITTDFRNELQKKIIEEYNAGHTVSSADES
ncbi:MAG: septation regulator SpoVG [Treponema sp.]